MRWKQSTYLKTDFSTGYKFTILVTIETVAPFRSFEQSRLYVKDLPLNGEMWKNGKLITRPLWLLPDNIDELINEMDNAREQKNWERSDEIRTFLKDNGIVVRNGVDWYPILLEKDFKAEKLFNSWLFSTWMSSLSSYEPKIRGDKSKYYKEQMSILEKEVKDKYNI